jgi:diaminohydroxyphosphoribosylaminopyrimidine deaminase/5-amino-6-(5-phosphoribosylamino)uracil reductase
MSAATGGEMDRDAAYMRMALELAKRGYGLTSPNPMVGAVLLKKGKVIGRGWHHRAGEPHAEIEALRDAARKKQNSRGADLFVTLEPCCTHGRTPPCTDAIIQNGIRRVIVGAIDPNPAHAGKGLRILEKARVRVASDVLAERCESLNEAFNHWIVHRRPFVTVKAAMTLDGRIATVTGDSKWITGPQARAEGMRLRHGADAILVGVNTIIADDPSLTFRTISRRGGQPALSSKPNEHGGCGVAGKVRQLRRFVLDSRGRTPPDAKILNDEFKECTTIILTNAAPARARKALERRVHVWVAPARKSRIDLLWALEKMGSEEITSLLVEGGGEVNASFLLAGLAQRIAFFYAPKIFGGRDGFPGVAGQGVRGVGDAIRIQRVEWQRLGADLYLTARLV